ncbi:MAG: pirin family protein [Myxococcota bacterium]
MSVFSTRPLGTPWATTDPFLFCMHHRDAYPPGNERMGPAATLEGRDLGQDFSGKDGWSMYHGRVVPGFPQHPHRGFETVTIARSGYIDHSDSLGAAARLGEGDVQWITAGAGIVHSEMFPLLRLDSPNPVELFQIWLNLPGEKKLVEPRFRMLWSEELPRLSFDGAEVRVVAGELAGQRPPPPPPDSWAAQKDTDVAIWCVRLQPKARWELPPAANSSTVRTLYFFRGPSLRVADVDLPGHCAAVVRSDTALALHAGDAECEVLLLQGRPIGQPVAQYGPFVMSSEAELRRAMLDYQRTHFGGWPWASDDPVHGRKEGRFAQHADGRVERKR